MKGRTQMPEDKCSMPKGTCPKCGDVYYGWGLLDDDDICACGEKLIVEVEGKEVTKS